MLKAELFKEISSISSNYEGKAALKGEDFIHICIQGRTLEIIFLENNRYYMINRGTSRAFSLEIKETLASHGLMKDYFYLVA